MNSRWYYTRRKTMLAIGILALFGGLFLFFSGQQQMDDINRHAAMASLLSIRQSMLQDSGGVCNIPNLPVNSSDMMKFVKEVPPLKCTKGAPDWVKCWGSYCGVKDEIHQNMTNLSCSYKPILWNTDFAVTVGSETTIRDHGQYKLTSSDFVQVECEGIEKSTKTSKSWTGHLVGIREAEDVKSRLSWEELNGQAMRYNVLMFGFDSLSRNTFIRKLKKSYKVLTEELNGHILEGYNIVGDGTPQALIPILTGFTELELPDTRKRMNAKASFVDVYPFIWNSFKENGYATLFDEDTPDVGIFTYRLKGFKHQPTDHYLRSYLLHTNSKIKNWSRYCNGEIPRHKIMMDHLLQFMVSYSEYPRFGFGFHGELSHDDYNLVQAADDDLAEWLRYLKSSNILSNTILILMSDHGHRFANIRDTLQGKQEERLPWFSFVLPKDIDMVRPGASMNLKDNTKRLTTPFDIHSTFLDILGLYENEHNALYNKVLHKSFSLFAPISANRSCGQAGIEPHWCACLSWKPISLKAPIVERLANELVKKLNSVVEPFKNRCATLKIESIEWAMSLSATDGLMHFKKTVDKDGFVPDLSAKTSGVTNVYQIKVKTLPGHGIFEASLTHNMDKDTIHLNTSDVSRINKYGDQARCVYDDEPELRKYCYCTRD